MPKCSKCLADKNENTTFQCDSCHCSLCDKCSGLSGREIQCMQLRERKLLFLCQECEAGFKAVPTLIKQIADLKNDVAELKKLPQKSNNYDIDDLEIKEDIVNEFVERNIRRKNVIVFNVQESQKNSKQDRITDEKNVISSLLLPTGFTADNIKTFRLGKFNNEKIRPIKVVFQSEDDALSVLKNKTKINNPDVRIYNDKTKMQLQYYKSLKAKLSALHDSGDTSKSIKYINGRPKIVDAVQERQQKN